MKSFNSDYSPVEGKTFSLFGNSASTLQYYETIRSVADKILILKPDIRELIDDIARFSSKKKILRKILKNRRSDNLMADILKIADSDLSQYTKNTEEHLRTLPVSKLFDHSLATTREQYHLYMLEIELTNRLFRNEFNSADKKIALLPYCLQDFTVSCKSERNGFDYQCKHCSSRCFQNKASGLLRTHKIEPYIWMEGDMNKLAKFTIKEKRTFGVLGIACIPELIRGMRKCRKNKIAVIGLPLNANRCVRWFGEFLPNSIDLSQLENLVSGSH